MTVTQTLEQRRARHAWEAVQTVKRSKPPEQAKEYRREAKRLPIRIMTAGLGHALAFAIAKDNMGKVVADDVADWVLTYLKPGATGQKVEGSARRLMGRIVEGDTDWLRRASEEALAYLQWLSRLAEAEIADETDDRARDAAK